MKDFVGNELNLGDIVAFIQPGYRSLRKGQVVKINAQMVKILYGKEYTCQIYPTVCVRLSSAPVAE